jgi:hypothetical protein
MHFPGRLNQVMRGQLAHLLLRNGDNGVTVLPSGFLITPHRCGASSLGAMRPQCFTASFRAYRSAAATALAVSRCIRHVEGFRIPAKTTTLPALFATLTFI